MARIRGLMLLLVASYAFAAVTCTTNLNPQGVLRGDASGYLSGCLTEGTGLTDNPATTHWNGAYIAWQISPTAGGYLYEYSWSGARTDVSYLIVGLSTCCNLSNGCLWDVQTPVWVERWDSTGNPGFPTGISFDGIKLGDIPYQAQTYSFSFKSNRVPVWQNFYIKNGPDPTSEEPLYAYNTGISQTTGLSYYIAAPDTVIPEPGFYGLLALGLAWLYMAARSRWTTK